MTQQKQSGGSGSTNVQIASVQVGLGYEDVRSIARDIFDQNFAVLTQQAGDVAAARAAEIRDEIVGRLSSAGLSADGFSQVEKQVALLEAQKGFAVSGDEELKKVLVDAVLSLSAAPERSLKSIVLQESVKIVSSLTPDQLKALSAIFAVRHVSFGGTNTLTELFGAYQKHINFSVGQLDITEGSLRHLEYLGCGKTSLSEAGLYPILTGNFPGLISAGYAEADLRTAFSPDPFPPVGVVHCLRDPTKLQIAALNKKVLEARSSSWTPHQKMVAAEKLQENLLSESAVEAEVKSISPEAAHLWSAWSDRKLKAFELTSVGIAIGHTCLSANGMDADLAIWL